MNYLKKISWPFICLLSATHATLSCGANLQASISENESAMEIKNTDDMDTDIAIEKDHVLTRKSKDFNEDEHKNEAIEDAAIGVQKTESQGTMMNEAQKYRSQRLQDASTGGMNPAKSRKYLRTDRDTYLAGVSQ